MNDGGKNERHLMSEIRNNRVGLSWEWIGLKVEGEVEGYSYFCLKCSLYGRDLLDNRIGRLHTNF